ncbi:hypothetical protein F5883DRAFT_634753 [Diaporthe sp. PMI_573]|nr:hypothetical protein F5883DRAFT_634753 [Diaporthaceae sp. PMI_573]
MDSISIEILCMIIAQVTSGGSNKNDTLVCLRVSQIWHQITSPIFYKHIVLDNTRMVPFQNSFRLDYGPQVRTLTLLISKEDELDQRMRNLSVLPTGLSPSHVMLHPQLDGKIRGIIPILKKLDNLASFSLSVEARGNSLLKRSTIANLVDALPAGCTSLELDTLGLDIQNGVDRPHLCDSLRRVMPRMHHVRIRVASVCPALLGTGELSNHHGLTQQSPVVDSPAEEVSSRIPYKPVDLPNINTLVVYCMLPSWCSTQLGRKTGYCGAGDSLRTLGHHIGPCWIPITTAMKQLATGPKPPPASACILAINATDELDLRPPLYQGTTVDRPTANTPQDVAAWEFGRYEAFIQVPDGRCFVTTAVNVALLAEGPAWCDTLGGGRVPFPALLDMERGRPSFASGLARAPIPPLKTGMQWMKEFPMQRLPGFLNANKVRTRLQEIGTRQVGGVYLAVDTLLAPNGSVRMFPSPFRKIRCWTPRKPSGRTTR